MIRLAILAAMIIGLVLAPAPPAYQCGSDAQCAATGIVTCPACPDYTKGATR